MKIKDRHCVIEYGGGCYSGCFWEYNYAYITAEGEFKNIYSSGRDGCENMEELETRLDENESYDIIHLDSQEEIDEFTKGSAVDFVLMVARWLDKNAIFDMEIKCEECGGRSYWDEMMATDLRGVGGIQQAHQGMMCNSCYQDGCCVDCGEYYGPDELDENHRCEWCAEEEKKREKMRILEEKKEELRKKIKIHNQLWKKKERVILT